MHEGYSLLIIRRAGWVGVGIKVENGVIKEHKQTVRASVAEREGSSFQKGFSEEFHVHLAQQI